MQQVRTKNHFSGIDITSFEEVVRNRHAYAREWKGRTGRDIVGYMCTYFPEEIVYAADMLPIRIISARKPVSEVDIHMSITNASEIAAS